MFGVGQSTSSITMVGISKSPKWDVKNFQTSAGRMDCARSIEKDNSANKIPEAVFEATPNVRKMPGQSMAEFYAAKHPHASLLFSDPEVQEVVLKAYITNAREEQNSHVGHAMSSVSPCLSAEKQDEMANQMAGHEWESLVKAQPNRAFVLRFLPDMSPVNQRFIAKKISDRCWGDNPTMLAEVSGNLPVFRDAGAKKRLAQAVLDGKFGTGPKVLKGFVENLGFFTTYAVDGGDVATHQKALEILADAICAGKLKFDSAKDKKVLAQLIFAGNFNDSPNALEMFANKLELFAANNIDAQSVVTHLETLEILANAISTGRFGDNPKLVENFAQFRSAEIEKIFAWATSGVDDGAKKILAQAILDKKFGENPKVLRQVADMLGFLATSAADVKSSSSFAMQLDTLEILVKVVGRQILGRDPQVLSKLAQHSSAVFIVDKELFGDPELHRVNEDRINHIKRDTKFNIEAKKFEGMAAEGNAFEQLNKFKGDTPAHEWKMQEFTGLGHLRSEATSSSASNIDAEEYPGTFGKRKVAESTDVDAGGESKKPKTAALMGFLGDIQGGRKLKSTGKLNVSASVEDSGATSSKTIVNTSVQKPIPVSTPVRVGISMAEIQAKALAITARAQQASEGQEGVNNSSSLSAVVNPALQTPQRSGGMDGLFGAENSVLRSAMKSRRENVAPVSPVPGSNNSTPFGTPQVDEKG